MPHSSFRHRVARDTILSPGVVVPPAIGVSVALGGMLMGLTLPVVAPAAVIGGVIGLGVLAKRWFVGRRRIEEKAAFDLDRRAKLSRRRQLDLLNAKLLRDGDPRTNQALRGLRDLEARFERLSESKLHRPAPIEVITKVRQLIDDSFRSLDRSFELHETAREVITDEARERVERARERVLDEVQASVDQLVVTLDSIRTLGIGGDEQIQLAEIRRELDMSLDVARRVDERMRSLEGQFEDAYARSTAAAQPE